MRRRALWAAIASLIALAALAPLLSVTAQAAQVQITSPGINEELRGPVAIIGSASTPNFQYYKVEYGVGPSPSDWAIIDRMFETPVINGQLVTWNTAVLPDGVYSLRLRVVKQDGNYDEFLLRSIIIANTRPTSTPTETGTPTPEATPGPGAAQTPASPDATPPPADGVPSATVQIITRSAPLTAPTATPTLRSALAGEEALPIDTEGWTQSFTYGALAMAAVFVVLGLVFVARRLL